MGRRVRVGSAAACNTAASLVSSGARLIGTFAGQIVAYEHAQHRLLARQVADADAEHHSGAMHLPEDVAFASHHDDTAPFVLMWSHTCSLEEEDTHKTNRRPVAVAYVADIETKSLVRIPLQARSESNAAMKPIDIQDGAVDCSGQRVVLIDSTSGRLWCWTSLYKPKLNASSPQAPEWTQRQLLSDGELATATDTSVPCVAAGRFVCSSLLGHCFTLVRASWDAGDKAAFRIEKWTFDVDLDWKQIDFSSARLTVDSPSESPFSSTIRPQLRMNREWTHGALAIGSTLIQFKANDFESLSTSRTTHSHFTLERQIIDVVWTGEFNTLALLHAHGTSPSQQHYNNYTLCLTRSHLTYVALSYRTGGFRL